MVTALTTDTDFGGFRNRLQQQQSNFLTTDNIAPGQLTRPKSWSGDDSRLRRCNSVFEMDSSLETPLDQTPPQTPQRRKVNRHRFGTDPSCYLIYQAREKTTSDESSDSGNDSGKEGVMTTRMEQVKSPVVDTSHTENLENSAVSVNSASPSRLPRVNSVKERISELEMQIPKRKKSTTQAVKINSRAGLVLNLANLFETNSDSRSGQHNHPRNYHPHHHHHRHSHHHGISGSSSSIPQHSRSFNYHDMNKPSLTENKFVGGAIITTVTAAPTTAGSTVGLPPPIPSPRCDSLRYSSHDHYHPMHPYCRVGTSVGLFARKTGGGSGKHSTPEELEVRSPQSPQETVLFREHHSLRSTTTTMTQLNNSLRGNLSMTSTATLTQSLNRLSDCIFSLTDIAVVPSGTVSKNKKKFVDGDLKRTHSFENRSDSGSNTTNKPTTNAGTNLPRTQVS